MNTLLYGLVREYKSGNSRGSLTRWMRTLASCVGSVLCTPITGRLRFVLELYSVLTKGQRFFFPDTGYIFQSRWEIGSSHHNWLKKKMLRLPDLPQSYNFHFQIYPPIIHSKIFISRTLNLPTFSWFFAISMLLMTIGAANRFKLQSQKQKQKLFKLALGF